jgi:hypothetical protein
LRTAGGTVLAQYHENEHVAVPNGGTGGDVYDWWLGRASKGLSNVRVVHSDMRSLELAAITVTRVTVALMVPICG